MRLKATKKTVQGGNLQSALPSLKDPLYRDQEDPQDSSQATAIHLRERHRLYFLIHRPRHPDSQAEAKTWRRLYWKTLGNPMIVLLGPRYMEILYRLLSYLPKRNA